MKIFLIGYRGSGKSTVAQLLSEKYQIPFYSLDQMIVEHENMSINEIVKQNNWDYFRKIESMILEKVISNDNAIIDCGGGIIEKEENRKRLSNEKNVFFLKASVNIIKQRINSATDRPALTDKDFLTEIEEVYKRRIPLYSEVAHYIINADDIPSKIVEEISLFLEK